MSPHNFNEAHPTLTHLTLVGLQTAVSGPVGIVKDQVLKHAGVQDQVDTLVGVGKHWISDHLQSKLSIKERYADLLTEGGAFGLVFGLSTLGAGSKDKILDSAKGVTEKIKTLTGRTGKQQRLKQLANDDKLGSVDRGWIKQEINAIDRKSTRVSGSGELKPQTNIRVPPGKELAHRRGKAAKDGHSYEHSDLQSMDLHRLQHKHEGYK